MIYINLLPEEYRKKELPKFMIPEIPIMRTLTWVALLYIAIHVTLLAVVTYRNLELGALRGEVKKRTEQTRDVAEKKTETERMQRLLGEIGVLTNRPYYWSGFLNALNESVTKGVWLRGLSVIEVPVSNPPKPAEAPKPKKTPAAKNTKDVKTPLKPERAKRVEEEPAVLRPAFKLEGSAIGRGGETAAIGRFVKSVETHALFSRLLQDVQLSTINQRRIQDTDVYDFTLIMPWKEDAKKGTAA